MPPSLTKVISLNVNRRIIAEAAGVAFGTGDGAAAIEEIFLHGAVSVELNRIENSNAVRAIASASTSAHTSAE